MNPRKVTLSWEFEDVFLADIQCSMSYFRTNLCLFYREFRDATRVFARFKSHSEWEEFLNGHLSKYVFQFCCTNQASLMSITTKLKLLRLLDW